MVQLTGPFARRRALVMAGFAAVAALALVLGVLVGRGPADAAAGGGAESLFAVTLPDARGHPQSLGQWRGNVLIVNFWATWCAPCRDEVPQFVAAQRELGPRGVQFVGIAVDDAAKVRLFADELKLNYPALIGGYGAMELSKTYGNRLMALPFTVIIDRTGRIAHTQLGPLKADRLHDIVGHLL